MLIYIPVIFKVVWMSLGYMEAIALNAVKVSRKGASYGGQRLFGSLGIVAANFMTGALVDNYYFQGLSLSVYTYFSSPNNSLIVIHNVDRSCWLCV